MKPYEYDEPDQDVQLAIKVGPGGSARVRINDCGKELFVDISASRVPDAALALYEAARLPEPLIVDNWTDDLSAIGIGTPLVTVDPSPAGSRMNLPGVMIGVSGTRVRLVRDEPLRVACALISAMRKAEAEPDPAQVDQLADLIGDGFNLEATRALARKLLLGGYVKREPGQ